jgi:RNA polymerase II subunit A small phosphatase-like protein
MAIDWYGRRSLKVFHARLKIPNETTHLLSAQLQPYTEAKARFVRNGLWKGKNMAPVRLIVFDLDETLVHATEVPLPYAHTFQVGPYFVYVRPFASELIKFSALHFDVAVWSSSSERYVEAVTSELFGNTYPVVFSWAISKCVQKIDPRSNGYVYVKDLRKAIKHGYAPEEIIMIDDSPEKLQRQPARHLCLSAFTGDPLDKELIGVIERIKSMTGMPSMIA